MYRRGVVVAVVWVGLICPRAWAVTILEDDFTLPSVDANVWHIEDAGASVVGTSGGTNLLVQNVDGGSGFWGGGRGIWNRGSNLTEPLFTRPTGTDEVNVYFFGVDMQNKLQRVAFGLSSFNEFGEGGGEPQTEFALPDGDGQGDRLSYSFWFRPDDSFFGNFVRTKTVNQHSAATTGHAEQEWALDGSLRDFRIRVTEGDVEWYMRTVSTGSEDDPWLLVRDPFATNNAQAYSGSESGGRDKFRVFVHGASAGADGGASWVDSDLLIDRILVTGPAVSTSPDGDYNGNGVVDAADYVLWRKSFGDMVADGTGADGSNDGTINQADYDFWRSKFGSIVGSGSSSMVVAAVPEPGACLLLQGAMLFLLTTARNRTNRRCSKLC